MSPLPKNHSRAVIGLLLVFCISGCGTAAMIDRSTRALEKTAQSMDKTREVLRQSDRTMKQMSVALRRLDEPMQRVAALGGPMREVAALQPSMERLGTRMAGVEERLENLEQPLEKVAMLMGPLQDVAALGSKMDAVADIAQDRKKLTAITVAVMATWAFTIFGGVYLGLLVGMRRMRRGIRR